MIVVKEKEYECVSKKMFSVKPEYWKQEYSCWSPGQQAGGVLTLRRYRVPDDLESRGYPFIAIVVRTVL